MHITVNGQSRQIEANLTVEKLLDQLELSQERIAVEHNLTILQPAQFSTAALQDGDTLEIVRFVGGG